MGTFDDINLERTEVWNAPPPRQAVLARDRSPASSRLCWSRRGFAWWMRTRPAPSADIERMASSVPARAPPRTSRCHAAEDDVAAAG